MATKQGIADRVAAILQKGQRVNMVTAQARLGLSMRQYQRAIALLRDRGHVIDTDIAPKIITTSVGSKRRCWIATHQLLR